MNCIQKDYSFPKTEGIDFAIVFGHKRLGYTVSCPPFVVSSILEVAKSSSVHKARKKKPITIEHLKLLYQELAVKSQNLSSFRLLIMCILDFCGPMRYSDTGNLRKPYVTFHNILIKYLSKNAKLMCFAKETLYIWSNKPEIHVLLKFNKIICFTLINNKSNK